MSAMAATLASVRVPGSHSKAISSASPQDMAAWARAARERRSRALM